MHLSGYLALSFYVLLLPSFATNWHSETSLPFSEYCQQLNYSVQEHKINTKDGYILTYFRFQARNSPVFRNDLPVVLFHHGFIDSSDTWVVNSDPLDNAPAFFFAERGFDVWLGNSRGNKHSRQHILYDPDKDSKFWDFSWQEMAENDLPAAFDYITTFTNQPQITYIGHSQGTIIMLAALSEKIEAVRSKLKKFIALGPLISLKNSKSFVYNLIGFVKATEMLERFGINEVLGDNWFTSSITVLACRVANILCQGGLLILSDMKPSLDNNDRMDVIMGHYPSGTSIRDFDHLVQMSKTTELTKYDFGSDQENMLHYGQKTPPILNLGNIDAEVHLYVGKYDELADLDDFSLLVPKLNGTKKLTVNEIEGGHATFLWGKNMSFLEQVLENVLE